MAAASCGFQALMSRSAERIQGVLKKAFLIVFSIRDLHLQMEVPKENRWWATDEESLVSISRNMLCTLIYHLYLPYFPSLLFPGCFLKHLFPPLPCRRLRDKLVHLESPFAILGAGQDWVKQ